MQNAPKEDMLFVHYYYVTYSFNMPSIEGVGWLELGLGVRHITTVKQIRDMAAVIAKKNNLTSSDAVTITNYKFLRTEVVVSDEKLHKEAEAALKSL